MPLSLSVLKATINKFGHGLVTVQVSVPRFIWTELLTYRREIARNGSSHRATKSVIECYRPAVWYKQGDGMTSSDIPAENQSRINAAYERMVLARNDFFAICEGEVVSKEQYQREYPTTSFIHGLITASEDTWKHIINQRVHPTADRVMRELFNPDTCEAILNPNWVYSPIHMPVSSTATPEQLAAQFARVSYGSFVSRGATRDQQLADQLIADGHLSPFEHIAYESENPLPNAFMSLGWETLRARIEVPHGTH